MSDDIHRSENDDAVRAALARRFAEEQADADAEVVDRALRIRKLLEARLRAMQAPAEQTAPAQAASEPAPPAPAPEPRRAPAPPAAAAPAAARPIELSREEKLRILRAYGEQRKARLEPRSALLWPRSPSPAQPADADPRWSSSTEGTDTDLEQGGLRMSQSSTALPVRREPLGLDLDSFARRRGRRRFSVD